MRVRWSRLIQVWQGRDEDDKGHMVAEPRLNPRRLHIVDSMESIRRKIHEAERDLAMARFSSDYLSIDRAKRRLYHLRDRLQIMILGDSFKEN
jgi:hypothetical protein